MASYPSSVVVFTDKETGDTIEASHINALQDEVVAIEEALLNGTSAIASSRITAASLQVSGGSTLQGGLQSSNSTLSALVVSGGSTLQALQSSNSTVASLQVSGGSTLSSNVVIRGPRPWLDVRAYGAVGDGATDDSTAIQGAINQSSAVQGFPPTDAQSVVVFLPQGHYRASTTITVSTNFVILRGAGAGVTLLRCEGVTGIQIGSTTGAAVNRTVGVRLEDMTLIAANSTITRLVHLQTPNVSVASVAPEDVVIDNVECRTSSVSTGVDALVIESGVTNVQVRGCVIRTGFRDGIQINSTSAEAQNQISILNTKINGASRDGIFADALTGLAITNVFITGETNSTACRVSRFRNCQQVSIFGSLFRHNLSSTWSPNEWSSVGTLLCAGTYFDKSDGGTDEQVTLGAGTHRAMFLGCNFVNRNSSNSVVVESDVTDVVAFGNNAFFLNQSTALAVGYRDQGANRAHQITGALQVSGASTLSNLQVSSNSTIAGTLIVSSRVGIGTTPAQLVHLAGTNPTLRIEETQGGEERTWDFQANANQLNIQDITAGATRLTIDSNGRVAVAGTFQSSNSTVSNLSVSGPSTFSTNVLFRGQSPWIDVKAYGAVGDGVADDSTAFAAASSAVSTNGAIIFVPPGSYLLSTTWTLPADRVVTVAGAGIDATELRITSSNANGISYTANGFTSKRMPITIRDLSITANTDNAGKGIAINFPDAASVNEQTVLIERVMVRPVLGNSSNGWEVGIELDDCWYAKIHAVAIHGNNSDTTFAISSRGISLLTKSMAVGISDVTIYNVAQAVSMQNDVEGLNIRGCEFVTVGTGIRGDFSSQTPGYWITNTHIAARDFGIWLDDVAQVSVTGCNITRSAVSTVGPFTAIRLGGNVTGTKFGQITGNHLNGGGGSTRSIGVLCDTNSCDAITISGNTFQVFAEAVRFNAGSDSNIVMGNIGSGVSSGVVDNGTGNLSTHNSGM